VAYPGQVGDNIVMPSYVRWYRAEDDLWNYDELDPDRRSLRHVEQRGIDGDFVTAAGLAELLSARDSSGLAAVQDYERRYGVVPEASFPPVGITTDPS
jgi:hypothetical protein